MSRGSCRILECGSLPEERPIGARYGGGTKDLMVLDSPPFGRPTSVVGDGRHVADERDFESGSGEGSQSGFAATAGSFDEDGDGFHAVVHGFARGIFGGLLGGEGGTFSRAFEAFCASARPCQDVAVGIGYGDEGVVECGLDVCDADGDILFDLFACTASFWSCHGFILSDLPRAGLSFSHGVAARSFAGTGIGFGPLSAYGQATAVAQASVATDVHEAFDVHGDFATEIPFDLVFLVDDFTNALDFAFA